MKHLKVLDEESNENDLIIEGYLALFGGDDLVGERFEKSTLFDSDYTRQDVVLIDWEHGMRPDGKASPGRDNILGRVDWKSTVSDDTGLLVRRILDRRNKYVSQIVEPLARAGLLASSSEAVSELVQKTTDGTIEVWPIKRDSLTVNPAEPRLLTDNQMQVIKSLSDTYPAFKAYFAEAEQENGADSEDATKHKEENNMAEMHDTPVVESVSKEDFDSTVKGLSDKLDAITTALEKIPTPKKADIVPGESEEERALKGNPFTAESFYENVRAAGERRQFDDRLKPLKSTITDEGVVFEIPENIAKSLKAPSGASEGVPADGGFLVGTDLQPGVMQRDYMTGQVWGRAMNIPIGANANGTVINAIKENSRVAGSRWGGVVAYWLGEADEITATKPKFRQLEPKLKKVAAMVYATEELLQDTTAFVGVVNATVPKELMYQKDAAAFDGSGVGKPLGFTNSDAFIAVAKESGQGAATIVAENVIKMWARRWGSGHVWFVNRDVTPQLYTMEIGSGGQLVYMPPGGLSGLPYGTIFGAPVIEIEHCNTLGTLGDIVLADMSQYLTISKGGIKTASSIHVRFAYDESVYRFVERVDGMPVWDTPLTPAKGTNTLSPFVGLATRA